MRAILVLLLLLLATPAAALRVVVVSDLNGSYGSTEYGKDVYAAVEAIISIGPDLVISTGDMVAGQRRPHLTEPEIRAMWRGFHAVVSDPLAEAGIPFLVTPGNHDASAYGGFEREREIFREEWRTRTPPWPVMGNWPLQYAVDVEGIRFTSLDVTTVGSFSVGQTEDLKQLFEGAGETRIVFSHIPLWEFAEGRETEIIGDADLSLTFGTLGVDLHLSGHHHAFFPGASDGIAYLGQACLGASPRRLIGADEPSSRGITLLDIDVETGDIVIDFWASPDFEPGFDMSALPHRLDGFETTLVRIDLADLPSVHLESRK